MFRNAEEGVWIMKYKSLCCAEGADIVMVKPALPYLHIILTYHAKDAARSLRAHG